MARDFIKKILNPSAYKRRKYYYAHFSEQYSTYASLLRQINPKSEEYTTISESISYRNIAFNDSYKKIKEKMGAPNIDFINPVLKQHRILFYIQETDKDKVKSELHLLKDKFFLAKNILEQPTKESVASTKKALQEKYKLTSTDSLSEQFEDTSGNHIIIRNNVRFEVSYVSGDDFFKSFLASKTEENRNNSENENELKDLF